MTNSKRCWTFSSPKTLIVSKFPIPILADKQNTARVNEERAVLNHFYRDIWERKPPTRQHLELLERVPKNTVDYPEYEAFLKRLNTLPTYDIILPRVWRGGASTQEDKDASEAGSSKRDESTQDDGKGRIEAVAPKFLASVQVESHQAVEAEGKGGWLSDPRSTSTEERNNREYQVGRAEGLAWKPVQATMKAAASGRLSDS
ncbi:hypothetical protein VTI74DRAFT_4549 [Chaetomium olivicolor]